MHTTLFGLRPNKPKTVRQKNLKKIKFYHVGLLIILGGRRKMFITRANVARWLSSCSTPSQPLLKPLLWGEIALGSGKVFDKNRKRGVLAMKGNIRLRLQSFPIFSLFGYVFTWSYGHLTLFRLSKDACNLVWFEAQ